MSTRIASPRPPMRKQPAQARSHATVDAIIKAGAQVLADKGRTGFNTNKVAEVAGVNIGSLYQYFPNKLTLIDAVRTRHLDDVLAVLAQAVEGAGSRQQLAENLVHGVIAVHTVQPALHRVLLEEAPRYDGSTPMQAAFEAEYESRYRAVVAASIGRAKVAGGAGQEVVAQVLAGAMEGVIHSAARNGTLKSPKLKRELVCLVAAYLACH